MTDQTAVDRELELLVENSKKLSSALSGDDRFALAFGERSKQRSESPSYVEEFDTLRAMAAFAVMAAHFAHGISPLISRVGWPGVILFFCLSGYLITGILLRCRGLVESQSAFITLKRFYLRRALRIFPLYYLAIGVFFVLLPAIRDNIWWFIAYAVNIGKSVGVDGFAPLNHLWTLAVEEQFYIVWPFIILLLPTRYHLRFCVAMVALASLSRLVLHFAGGSPTAVQQLTTSCLDALGLGACFAVAERDRLAGLHRAAVRMLAFAAPLAILVYMFASQTILFNSASLVYSLAFAPAIYLVARNAGTPRLAVLRWAPTVFLGKISYGIYVWHLPVMWAYPRLLQRLGLEPYFGLPSPFGALARIVTLTLLTLLVACVSWFAFERPINSLKTRFPYKGKAQ